MPALVAGMVDGPHAEVPGAEAGLARRLRARPRVEQEVRHSLRGGAGVRPAEAAARPGALRGVTPRPARPGLRASTAGGVLRRRLLARARTGAAAGAALRRAQRRLLGGED